MKRLLCILFAIVIILSGCASAPMITNNDNPDDELFVPISGTASIFISRTSELPASNTPFRVLVDGQETGPLYQGTWRRISVPAGEHKIEIKAGLTTASETVTVQSGKNYFVSTGSKAGSSGTQPEMSFVLFEEMGRIMIRQSKPAN
jgi:hypothetical protein